MMLRRLVILSVLASLVLIPSVALTQQGPPGGGGGPGAGPGGPGGGPPNFDPAQFRERMMKMWQEQLGASDDEWKVLTPKLEKVMNAQRDSRGGFGFFGGRGGPGGGFGGGPGGPGGPGGTQQESKVAKAQRELRTLLDNKDAPAAEVTKLLAAYREARTKARAELEAAQKELKELVTPRQEALLVMAGMLE